MSFHQLSNNLKLFVTSNLSIEGTLLTSGFSKFNTSQIIPVKDSVTISQNKTYDYIENANSINSDITLKDLAGSSLGNGTLSLSVTMGTSNEGPPDRELWNFLLSTASYPSNYWEFNTGYSKLKLHRKQLETGSLCILIVLQDITYVLYNARVKSVTPSLSLDDVTKNSWELEFTTMSMVTGVHTSISNNILTMSGALTGQIPLDTYNYSFAAGRFTKVGVYSTSDVLQGYLAATDLSLSISNTLNYIENRAIDRDNSTPIYVSSSVEEITGNIGFFVSGNTNYGNVLLSELDSNTSPFTTTKYRIEFTLFNSIDVPVCTIYLGDCVFSSNTDIQQAVKAVLNYNVVTNTSGFDPYIKFYT